jgi:hypothetical protein
MVVQIKVPPKNQTNMATKTSRASIAQKRKVKNQRRAVKAHKRNAAANQSKAKSSVNNYSNPKTNEMGQTNTIGVMVKVKTKAGVNNFIAFETDNEEFLPIHEVVSKRENLSILEFIWGAEIVSRFESQLTPNHDFSMLVLNYLCATKYRQIIANNEGASFGVVIDLDETKNLPAIELFSYHEWELILDKESKKGSTKIYN